MTDTNKDRHNPWDWNCKERFAEVGALSPHERCLTCFPYAETEKDAGPTEGSMGRHPSTIHMLTVLRPNPNLQGLQFHIATACNVLASDLVNELNDSPELTAGLRKLMEAKDCFVRASLDLEPVDYRDR